MIDNNTDISEKERDYKSDYPEYPTLKNDDNLNSLLTRFFKVILMHKWLFLTIMIIVASLVIIYASLQPRMYVSNYEVFYNETMREYVGAAENASSVVKSDFDKNYWLSAMVSNEVLSMTLKNCGLTYTLSGLKSMIQVSVFDKRKEDRIPVYLVQLSCTQREHIPLLIRAYVKALNELLLQNQISNSERLIAYLTNQLGQNNQKLNEVDIELMQSGAGNGTQIIDFEKISSSLDRFRTDLLNARVALASIISARQRTELELRNLDGTIISESAFTEPLKVQLMNLEVDLARSLTRNKEDHPEIKQLRSNIDKIGNMIRDTVQQRLGITSMTQNPVKIQLIGRLLEYRVQEVSEETKVRSLEKIIAELEIKTLPSSINKEQQQILRNREMVNLTIKQLNDKLIESQTTSRGSLSRFVFIDDPSVVFLANKGIMFYVILAILLGIILASIIVFLYDLLDDRIMFTDDYERFYSYPLMGVVKHYKPEENYFISQDPNVKYLTSNENGSLIVNIRQFIKLKGIKTILISSPDRKEGKSLVSLKLATEMANKKQKVLLVDMDFFSPKLSTKLLTHDTDGLSNYLMSESELNQVIQQTEIETLHFLSAGNVEGHKELFYNSNRLAEFMNWAKKNYDVVFIDTPAAIYIPDIIELFEHVDSIIVIARLQHTTRKLLNSLFKIVAAFKNKYISVILNDFHTNRGDYYDNTTYSYSVYNDSSKETKEKNKRRPKNSILFLIIFAALIFCGYIFYFWKNSNFNLQLFPHEQPKVAVPDTISKENYINVADTIDSANVKVDTLKYHKTSVDKVNP
jgi:capsular exopolysaccharide synthesis family protein